MFGRRRHSRPQRWSSRGRPERRGRDWPRDAGIRPRCSSEPARKPPAHIGRRRTRREAASSVGQIAQLLFGLPASLPRLVRRSPDAHAKFPSGLCGSVSQGEPRMPAGRNRRKAGQVPPRNARMRGGWSRWPKSVSSRTVSPRPEPLADRLSRGPCEAPCPCESQCHRVPASSPLPLGGRNTMASEDKQIGLLVSRQRWFTLLLRQGLYATKWRQIGEKGPSQRIARKRVRIRSGDLNRRLSRLLGSAPGWSPRHGVSRSR